MKIILSAKCVYPFHPVGGIQKYVYFFAKHLANICESVEVIAPADKHGARQEIIENVKFTLLEPYIYDQLEHPAGWWGVHRFGKSLARYLTTQQFDVLHSFDMSGLYYSKLPQHQPVIAQVYTDNYLCNPIPTINPLNLLKLTGNHYDAIKNTKLKLSPFDSWDVKIKYWLQFVAKVKPMYQLFSKIDHIFFEDESISQDVQQLYRLKPEKCHVLPVGTDIGLINKIKKNFRGNRRNLNLKDDDIVCLTVNRLAADKGIDKMILAMKSLVRQNDKIKLVIIGSGYQEKEIHQMIKENHLENNIIHPKDIGEDRLYEFYLLSDIYLCAFSFPGSSLSSLEAMACGLPIITSAQLWLIDGNGVFIQNNEPDTIAEAISSLIDKGNLKNMGLISQKKVQQYDWPVIVAQAKQHYANIINGMV